MYDIKGTICELIDEENYILHYMGEYSLRAVYGRVPITQELYDELVINLTENKCTSLIDIFFTKHRFYND